MNWRQTDANSKLLKTGFLSFLQTKEKSKDPKNNDNPILIIQRKMQKRSASKFSRPFASSFVPLLNELWKKYFIASLSHFGIY
jgi:hypothetical protein